MPGQRGADLAYLMYMGRAGGRASPARLEILYDRIPVSAAKLLFIRISGRT